MRITIVQGAFLPVPPLLGGAVEKVWFNLGKEFARQGHTVVHLSRAHSKLPRHEMIEGVRHQRVSGFASPRSFARRVLLDLWYAARVMPLLPKADILVTNTFWLPALERRKSRGLLYTHVARYPKGQMKLYGRAILQTVSDPIKAAIVAEVPAAAERVRVIPYPLAERYLLPAVPQAGNTILYVGRVHPEKGVHLLIEGFARSSATSGWKLQIVGPWEFAYGGGGEEYFSELKKIAAPLGEKVEFVGRVFDENKLVEHYAGAKIFAYPSLAEKGETFGLSALEAMAAGCCPIVSNLGCFQDFIRSEVNGLIFDHRSSSAAENLAATLDRAIREPVFTDQLRAQAWKDARGFTMERISAMFLKDFSELTQSNPFVAKP